jgi:hypothetical protein
MLSYLSHAIALFALASSIAARADDYPSRPVKFIAPFGAGGPTDVFTRDIAEELRNVASIATQTSKAVSGTPPTASPCPRAFLVAQFVAVTAPSSPYMRATRFMRRK